MEGREPLEEEWEGVVTGRWRPSGEGPCFEVEVVGSSGERSVGDMGGRRGANPRRARERGGGR